MLGRVENDLAGDFFRSARQDGQDSARVRRCGFTPGSAECGSGSHCLQAAGVAAAALAAVRGENDVPDFTTEPGMTALQLAV